MSTITEAFTPDAAHRPLVRAMPLQRLRRDGRTLEGLRLDTTAWAVQPGEVLSVESSFFDALPAGSATLDCVLVMRNVPITWTVPAGVGPAGPATATAGTTAE